MALGAPVDAYNKYEALVPCDSVAPAQCCDGVGHALLSNATVYSQTAVKYNSLAFKLFSLDISVGRHAPLCLVLFSYEWGLQVCLAPSEMLKTLAEA